MSTKIIKQNNINFMRLQTHIINIIFIESQNNLLEFEDERRGSEIFKRTRIISGVR